MTLKISPADTIARALEKFRVDVLGAGTWNPKKGASLKTFWIGYCVLKYPDLYDRWCTQQRHWIQGLELAEHDADRPPDLCYQDPARQHDLADVVNEALRSVGSNATAKVLVLQEAGYSHAEIAELLDTTVKAIESTDPSPQKDHQCRMNRSTSSSPEAHWAQLEPVRSDHEQTTRPLLTSGAGYWTKEATP